MKVRPDGYAVADDARTTLDELDLIHWEGRPWQRVNGFVPVGTDQPESYQLALKETAPESGSFILFSMRRRNIGKSGTEKDLRR